MTESHDYFAILFKNLIHYLDVELKLPLPIEAKTTNLDTAILLCRLHIKPKLENLDEEVNKILPQLSGAQQSEINRLTSEERHKIKRYITAMCELV